MTEEEGSKTNQPDGTYAQRRSQWRSSLDALAYISSLVRKPELKTRDSDRVTGLAVLLASCGFGAMPALA